MADQHPRPAVLDDVGDLLGLEVPVDRHGVGTDGLRAVRHLDEGDVVAHQDRHAIAGLHAKLRKPGRYAAHALVQLGVRDAASAADEAR